MKYTEEELKRADRQIKELIDSGKYKQLGYEVLDSLSNIKINEKTSFYLKQTTDLYLQYLDMLFELSDKVRSNVLKTFKNADIIDNQELEYEDSFLIALSVNSDKTHAIDKLLELNNLNLTNVKKVHKTLIHNTSAESKFEGGFRDNNRKFVGQIVNGEKIIQYFPIDYSEIENVMQKILMYYNDKSNESVEGLFVKPIIVHGLIAAYQPFNDGNTRFARLLQHIKIHNMTNKYTKYKLSLPAVYATRMYYPYRQEYRNLINKLVLNPSSNSWNEWLVFNLKKFQDRLYYSMDKIEEIKQLNNHKKR